MASSADNDSEQRFALGFLIALIALVIFFVIGIGLWAQGRGATPSVAPAVPVGASLASPVVPAAVVPAVAVVTETVTVTIPDGASVRVVDGVVNFYFATGSADLAPGAAEALAVVIKGVQDGRKAVVSGFHDTTGDAAINAELAKKRAEMVRDVLIGLAVPADKIDLQKPAVSTGSGNDAQARRVEVKLLD